MVKYLSTSMLAIILASSTTAQAQIRGGTKVPPSNKAQQNSNSSKIICGYDASPQGFKVEISENFNSSGQSRGYQASVSRKKSAYFTANPPAPTMISAKCDTV